MMFGSHLLTLDDVERSLGVSVEDERRQNGTEAVELCQFQLVSQGGGGNASQRTDTGKRPGRDHRIRDLTRHHCCFRKRERDVIIFVDRALSAFYRYKCKCMCIRHSFKKINKNTIY